MIVFNPLGERELHAIVDILLDDVNRTLASRGFSVVVTPEVKLWLLERAGLDPSTGARPLRRALQKYVEDPLSEALIQGQLAGASVIEVFQDDNVLGIRPLPTGELPEEADPLDAVGALVH